MIIDANFEESEKVISADLGKVVIVPSGDYETGYHEGYETGRSNGYAEGTGHGVDTVLLRNLTEYHSDEISALPDYSLYKHAQLTSVTFPNLTSIGTYAFAECSSLVSVVAPKMTNIGQYAFQKCASLLTADFPQVKTLANYSFEGCTSLKSVNMPLVTSISYEIFDGCSSLESAYFPDVTMVYNYGFRDCVSLRSVYFPKLATVNMYAFGSCAVSIYDAPFQSIASRAFDKNANLKAFVIRYLSRVCTLSNVNAFADTPIANGTGYIYVPSALLSNYKTASNWSTYAAQFRALEEYTVDGTATGALDQSKI